MQEPKWIDIAWQTYKRIWDDNVGLIAAGVTFYGFFALLSLLVLLVLSYGFFSDPADVVETMRDLTSILPGDIATLIGDQLMIVVRSSETTKGLGIFIAFVIAIYGGTNGAIALITALNVAYDVKEKRGFLAFYLLAVTMTLIALLLILLALASSTALAFLQQLDPEASPATVIAVKVVGYALLIPIGAGIVATLYRFAPSRSGAKWKWFTPGSLLAAVSWLALTVAFGLYLSDVTDYKAAYGSLAAVIALLTWMYFSAYAFLCGAELNSEIEHRKHPTAQTVERKD
jgi:membrane protein